MIFLEILVFLISVGIVLGSVVFIWVSSFTLPDFNTIATRQLESTTKIYDRTGKILLYAFREKIRRKILRVDDGGGRRGPLRKSVLRLQDMHRFFEFS